jgi:hypothetical protein
MSQVFEHLSSKHGTLSSTQVLSKTFFSCVNLHNINLNCRVAIMSCCWLEWYCWW